MNVYIHVPHMSMYTHTFTPHHVNCTEGTIIQERTKKCMCTTYTDFEDLDNCHLREEQNTENV